MNTLESLLDEVRTDRACADVLPLGPRPVVQISATVLRGHHRADASVVNGPVDQIIHMRGCLERASGWCVKPTRGEM
jgi:hypothetical protein